MMQLHVIARGKIGRSPEADLVARYEKRITWPLKITELPDNGGKIPPEMPNGKLVLLDEKGAQLVVRKTRANIRKMARYRYIRNPIYDWRGRWLWYRRARKSGSFAGLWRGDMATSDGACHVNGANLPRHHHHCRPSLSPFGLSGQTPLNQSPTPVNSR